MNDIVDDYFSLARASAAGMKTLTIAGEPKKKDQTIEPKTDRIAAVGRTQHFSGRLSGLVEPI